MMTGNHRKILLFLHMASYNANTDSYTVLFLRSKPHKPPGL